LAFEKIVCPKCRKRLFDADIRTRGEIYAYCKFCKKSMLITLPVKRSGAQASEIAEASGARSVGKADAPATKRRQFRSARAAKPTGARSVLDKG